MNTHTSEQSVQFALIQRIASPHIALDFDDAELALEWAEYRPDLCARFQLTQYPVLVAWYGQLQPLVVLPVASGDDVFQFMSDIRTKWNQDPDRLIKLAADVFDEAASTATFEISTLLLKEWKQRVTRLVRSNLSLSLPEHFDLLHLLMRFHDWDAIDNIVSEFIERTPETLAQGTSHPEYLQFLINLSLQAPDRYHGELIQPLQTAFDRQFDHLHESLLALDSASEDTLPFPIEQITPALVATYVNTAITLGWRYGGEWWTQAANLLQLSLHRFNLLAPSARGSLSEKYPAAPVMLTSFVDTAHAAMQLYTATAQDRWLQVAMHLTALAVDRYECKEGLDWFPRGHSLHGSTFAIHSTGIVAELAVQFWRTTQNNQWEAVADRLLQPNAAKLLQFPVKSSSLASALLRIFNRDIILTIPWRSEIPAEWRIAVAMYLAELRIERGNADEPVRVDALGKQEHFTSPADLLIAFHSS